MNEGRIRFSELLRLPVIDAGGDRLAVLDVRTAQPSPPEAPHVLGLLCSRGPRLRSLGLKRHDAAHFLGRRKAHAHGRFAPWGEIASIDADGIHLRCRFGDLERIADAPDSGPPAPRARVPR